MKKVMLSVVAAAVLSASSAFAADLKPVLKAPPAPPSPWDWAFGGALMSDYNFRGISQSNRGPSGTAYSETRYNVNADWQLYVGTQYWAVTLPTNPTCECDFYGGVRPTFGAFAFDFGFIYYYYPKEKQHSTGWFGLSVAPFPSYPNGNQTLSDTDYWEIYGKVTWDVMKDKFAVGANYYYSPDWLHTGAYGAYASVTAKYTLPSFKVGMGPIGEVGMYVSGELGHYWLGTTKFDQFVLNPAINLPDYTTWNLGISFTYGKVYTFDVRYYDTNLTKANCNVLTSDPNATFSPANVTPINTGGAGSKWCGASVVGALKFDLTAMANLK